MSEEVRKILIPLIQEEIQKKINLDNQEVLLELKARPEARSITFLIMTVIRSMLLNKKIPGDHTDAANKAISDYFTKDHFFPKLLTTKPKTGKNSFTNTSQVFTLGALNGTSSHGAVKNFWKSGLDKIPNMERIWKAKGYPSEILNKLFVELKIRAAWDYPDNVLFKCQGEVPQKDIRNPKHNSLRFRVEIIFNANIINSPKQLLKNLSQLYMEVERIVYHELTHMIHQGAEHESDREQGKASSGSVMKKEGYVAYLSTPHEVEAKVHDSYLYSKKQNIPFEEVVETEFRLLTQLSKYSDTFTYEDLMTKVKPLYMAYARNNFPCATLKNGKPISSACWKRPKEEQPQQPPKKMTSQQSNFIKQSVIQNFKRFSNLFRKSKDNN